MSPGLVSIIVASYNHAEYLKQRMDSLINQTYDDIEIIVIDDCSSDNSRDVLMEYQYNPKVRLVFKELNGGWVKVSNQGVGMAKGSFVIFANCDDFCEETLVESLVGGMVKHPSAGIAFCRSILVNDRGDILGDDFQCRDSAFRKKCGQDTLLSSVDAYRFLFHSCIMPNLSAVLFRRECFGDKGLFDLEYKVCSDWEFFFRVTESYDVIYIYTPLNHFRQHETTIRSATKDRIIYEEIFRLLLGRGLKSNLSFMEHQKVRYRIMHIWSIYLIAKSLNGVHDFPYHLRKVWDYDALALLFFLPAMIERCMTLFTRLATRGVVA